MQHGEASRLRADEADLERIMQSGLGPLDTGDEEALWVRIMCCPFCSVKVLQGSPMSVRDSLPPEVLQIAW